MYTSADDTRELYVCVCVRSRRSHTFLIFSSHVFACVCSYVLVCVRLRYYYNLMAMFLQANCSAVVKQLIKYIHIIYVCGRVCLFSVEEQGLICQGSYCYQNVKECVNCENEQQMCEVQREAVKNADALCQITPSLSKSAAAHFAYTGLVCIVSHPAHRGAGEN